VSFPRRAGQAYPLAVLRRLSFLLGAGLSVSLAVLTALVILGAGVVDPLLAAERTDSVSGTVLGLGGLAIGCLLAASWPSRGATSGRPE
jgi:hypothetical protein